MPAHAEDCKSAAKPQKPAPVAVAVNPVPAAAAAAPPAHMLPVNLAVVQAPPPQLVAQAKSGNMIAAIPNKAAPQRLVAAKPAKSLKLTHVSGPKPGGHAKKYIYIYIVSRLSASITCLMHEHKLKSHLYNPIQF